MFKRESVDGQTDGQTDGRTDGRYQTYYLPCFMVDNNTCLAGFVLHTKLQRLGRRYLPYIAQSVFSCNMAQLCVRNEVIM